MTENTGDFEGLRSAGDQESGAGVPHVMGPEGIEAGELDRRLKEAITPVLQAYWHSVGRSEQIVPVGSFEILPGDIWNGDGSQGRLGLAFLGVEMAFTFDQVLRDPNPVAGNASSPKPEDFTHPEPTPASKGYDASVSFVHRLGKRFHFWH